MQSKDKKNVFYVGIKDPIEIRRSLLESSKEIVQLMQDFERFKDIREQKFLLKEELKKDIAAIQKMMKALKKAVPKTELRVRLMHEHEEYEEELLKPKKKSKKSKKSKTSKKSSTKKAKPVEKKKPVTELDKLEDELRKIEEKLGNL